MGKPKRDITGQKFERLQAIRFIGYINKRSMWLCKCSCGGFTTARLTDLHAKRRKSCGCSRKLTNLTSVGKTHQYVKRMVKKEYESLFTLFKRLAKKANRSVDLTYDQFKNFTSVSKCHYCNRCVTWVKYFKTGQNAAGYNLDRKDNTLGYSVENCVVCCKYCNCSKRNIFTYEQWYRMTEPFRTGELKHEQSVSESVSGTEE